MKNYKSWILTDTGHNVWLDSFNASSDRLGLPAHQHWSVRKRTLHGGLQDGVDVVEIDNGALSFVVLPTRGMGLWQGYYRGLFLGWKSPVRGPVHPKFVNVCERGGIGWLAGFDEWLCRCGLAFNGPPGEDFYTDKQGNSRRDILSLHGRLANQPAHFVEVRVGIDAPHEISIVGQVEEGGMFYPRLHLTTTYTTVPGSNKLVIHDLVENRGAAPQELMVLYHCNMGMPFLGPGSRIETPIREVSPSTPRAAEGIDTLSTYAGPVAGFAEQVYLYELLGDATGRTLAMLYDHAAEKGVVLRFALKELPCFTMWRNTMALEEGYVTGLEPATNYPNLRTFERQQGRVPVLPPGGKWEATWSIEVHDQKQDVTRVLAEIAKLQSQAKPVIHRSPHARFANR